MGAKVNNPITGEAGRLEEQAPRLSAPKPITAGSGGKGVSGNPGEQKQAPRVAPPQPARTPSQQPNPNTQSPRRSEPTPAKTPKKG